MEKTRLWVMVLVSTLLFIGGIIILVLPISTWSYVLGIPSVQAGIIFLIFTFDKVFTRYNDKIEE